MHRRSLLAGIASLCLAPSPITILTAAPAAAGLPIPHAELKRLWQLAKMADDAADLMRKAPASWGGLPWSFEGPVQFHDPERLETVRVRVLTVRDEFFHSRRALVVDYSVVEPVRNRKIGSRLFWKAAVFDDSETDAE